MPHDYTVFLHKNSSTKMLCRITTSLILSSNLGFYLQFKFLHTLEPPLPIFIVTVSSWPQPFPSLAVSHCPLEQNKSKLPIFDMTGLFYSWKTLNKCHSGRLLTLVTKLGQWLGEINRSPLSLVADSLGAWWGALFPGDEVDQAERVKDIKDRKK